jgi:hypothetical protein
MGQTNLERTYFEPRVEITTLGNFGRQEVAFTGYFRIGDTVEILDVSPTGCVISILALATLGAIEKDTALVFTAPVDTSLATGTPYAQVRNIDDGQSAIDRLYRAIQLGQECEVLEPITDQALNSPLAGQATYDVGDIGYFRDGDTVVILHDNGASSPATVVSTARNADEANNSGTITIGSVIDTSAWTNPKFQLMLPVCSSIARLKSDIDAIDQPIENEDLDTPDCSSTVYETDGLFKSGTSHLYIDGRKLRLGTAGTRAAKTVGAGDGALTYTSMILGTAGNRTDVSVSAGAGLVVSVVGDFVNGYVVDCTDNGGAATAAQIAAAINASATAKRIVQVQYGGTGATVVAPFVATSLTGGLDDGTGDYAELAQIFENKIVATGYKWVSLWILPDQRNRLNAPPKNTEELFVDYRRILYNA